MERLALAIAFALILVACGNEAAQTSASSVTTSGESTASSVSLITDAETETLTVDDRLVYQGFDNDLAAHNALVALSRLPLDIFEAIGDTEPRQTLDSHTILGTPTIVAVLGVADDGWAEVMIPGRPNGSTGFVRTDDVELFIVDGRIVVDLSDRTLTYFSGGKEVLTTPVAIGNKRSPTPTGVFFVTDAVIVSDSSGPWGPKALGLSARSETITEFNGGDGIIGIHGTNNPSSIGEATSLGCVRLPNETIEELFSLAPVGTPVEIRA